MAGLGLTLAGAAGAYWPLVVAGLYGAGALIAPPERTAPPPFDPREELGVLRGDFGRLREYADAVELPAQARDTLEELLGLYAALLEPGWVADVLAADPEAVHAVSRAVRQDVPESVDATSGPAGGTGWCRAGSRPSGIWGGSWGCCGRRRDA